ncbi:MAG: YjbQ family protein [Rhodocyclaceae bacterium]|nr:YjbQ family protein [Rhodocyclaceae bacterium]
MSQQWTFQVTTRGRGTIEITDRVNEFIVGANVDVGIAHVFVRHTSCSLCITENADPAVRADLETLARRWAPDGDPAYHHNQEGTDDMAAHARSVLAGESVTVPVAKGCLLLGTWQGIFLWEHRTGSHKRDIVLTVIS